MRITMKNISGVLIDLSGTLHIEDVAIPGAIEAINRLRCSNLKFRFATNTSKESKQDLCNRLNKLAFDIQPDLIMTSLSVASDYVRKHQLNPFYMLQESALKEFPITKQQHDSVVIGLSPDSFNYSKLNKAFRLINSGAKFIAVNKSRYFKVSDGLSLGPGSFVSGLEYATNRKAICMGKPSPEFFEICLESMKLNPSNTAMIGDDVMDDIIAAQSIGMTGILVQTGKYKPGDENKVSDQSPHYVVPNIKAAIDLIIGS